MVFQIFLIAILIILATGSVMLCIRISDLKEIMYFQGLNVLGAFDDVDGTYTCVSPDTAVSVGIYLVTEGGR